MARTCLEVAKGLTGSRLAFMGKVNQARTLDIIFSDREWAACPQESDVEGWPDALSHLQGCFEKVIIEGRSLIANDLEGHPGNAAAPPDCPPLTAFLGAPLKYAGQTIGLIALGKIAGGFDMTDQEAVENLSFAVIEAFLRKQTEEALRKAEERYRSIFENAIEGTFQSTPEGRYRTANIAMAKMFGYESPEDLMANITDIRTQVYVDPQRRDEIMHQLERDGFVKEFEYQGFRKDGSTFWISENVRAVRNQKGEIYGYEGFMQDITERKRLEEALRDNEQFLTDIFNYIQDGLSILDPDLNIMRVNPAMEKFGYPQPLVGRKCYEVYQDRNSPCENCPALKTLLTGKASRNVVRGYPTNHAEQFLEILTYPLKDQATGQIKAVIEFVRDVTEHKQAEEERLRFSKLESLSTLAGGIAHDFNNILTAILGNIGLAALHDRIDPQVRGRLAQAEQACEQAQALSRQLLTFAKGGAPIKKNVSLAELLKGSAMMALSGSKSRCEFSIPEDLWLVKADAGQINQVIQNLLINADQAMPEGGIIKIRAENRFMEAESNFPIPAGRYVKFAVADQGVGISSKYLGKIFDPYFSTKQRGSGLGLATAFSIIKNHSGYMQVESQIGVGTTFQIYLPATDKEFPAEPETVKPTMGQGKVLVMDDDEMVREVLGRMLIRLGYEADFAGDGTRALEKFVRAKETNQPFDAVILDLTIPGGMGGKEAIQGLRKIDPQVKAVVSSGYSEDPIMANFREYGFTEVIAKPYRVAELSKILQKVIPGKRAK
ncbi:MAG: PAS domain S-box protein [Desulfobaccales bacterium]